MPIVGKFVADFTAFQTAVKQAEVSLTGMETNANKVGTSLNRMVDQFSGRKLVQDAQLMAQTFELLAEKGIALTTSELQKMGAVGSAAIEKLKASGQAVPPEIQKIVDAASKVKPALDSASSSATNLMGTLQKAAATFGIAFSVGAITRFVGSVLDTASAIGDLSQQLGISAEAAQRFKYAAEQSGSTIDAVATSIQFMNKTLGAGGTGTKAALEDIGLSFDAIRNMRPEDAFVAISDALGGMTDKAKQAEAGAILMGRGFAELLPAMEDGIKKVGDQTSVMTDDTIRELKRAQDAWASLGTWVTTVSGTIIANTISTVKSVTDSWQSFALFVSNVVETKSIGAALVLSDIAAKARELKPALDAATDRQHALGQAELAEQTREAAKALDKAADAAKKLKTEWDAYITAALKRGDAQLKYIEQLEAGFKKVDETVGKFVTGHLKEMGEKGQKVLSDAGDAAVRFGLDMSGLHPVVAGLGDEFNRAFTTGIQAARNMPPEIKKAKFELDDLSKALTQLATVAGGSFGAVASGLATIVTAANTAKVSITSITDVKGAFKAGDTMQGILGMASGIGGIVSSALAAGKAIWGIWKALENREGRHAVEDFAESFGGFDKLQAKLAELGEEGDRLWKLLTQGTDAGNPALAARNIAEVEAALAKQAAAQDDVTEATEEQAQATIETASQATKALEELGPKIKTNEDEWRGWGDVVTAQIQRIADAVRALPLPSIPGAAMIGAGAGGGSMAFTNKTTLILDGEVVGETVARQIMQAEAVAITITIAGVDRTDKVALESFTINSSLRDAGRCTFHTNDRVSTIAAYRPALFASVVVADGANILFNGTITSVKDVPVVVPHIGTRVDCEATAAAILDRLLVLQDYRVGPHPILNSSISSPTSLTIVNHGFVTGQRVVIEGHEASTPSINGEHVVTVQGPNNLSIPVNVTVAGGGGTIRRVMTLNEILQHLRGIYLHPTITWNIGNPTGPTIEAPFFDWVTVRAAFAALQGLTGYVIRVTHANVLQMFQPGFHVAPYELTVTNRLNVGPVTWTAKVGQYANTLVLKYGAEVQTTKTAVFTGTGALNNWTLEYEPVLDANGFIVSSGYVDESGAYLPIGLLAEITSSAATGDIITTAIPHGFETGASIVIQGHTGSTPSINGTHTITVLTSHTFSIPVNITVGGTGGTCYAPGLTWNYWPPANQMFRTAPLAAGAVATFAYTVQFPQQVLLQDAGEVTLRGVWEVQRTVTTIFDATTAVEWGNALLRRLMAQTVKTVTTATRQPMLLPGDSIVLTYPDRSVSDDHLLTDISGTADADKQMRWTLTAAAGFEVIDDWMDLLRDSIGSGSGGSVVGGGGVVSGGYIPPTSGGGGGGGGGGTGATGTIGTLAMFNTPTTLVSSIVSQSGTTITVAGNVVATHYTGSGAGLTSIPAEQLTGTIADARLSANIPRINASQIWTAAQRFNNGPTFFQGAAAADALRVLGRVADNMGRLSFYTADNVDLQGVIVGSGTGGAAKLGFGAASDVELLPNGNVILDPAANSVLPGTNYDINLGMLTRKYLTLHAAELWVETLVAQNTIATIGGRILVPRSTTVLTSDLASGATTILVKHNSLANGHRLIMEGNGQFECMFVTSGASGGGPYSYTVTRNEDGSGPAGGNNWIAGNAVVNTGTTGDGFIDIYAIAGVKSTSEEGPAIVGNVRQSATWNDWAPRWAIGNLNGVYGYSADTYGACFGDPAATNITIDATNGIRIRNATTNKLVADTVGNLSLTGDLTIGTSGVFHTAGASSLTVGTGIWMAGGATPVFRVGNPSGNQVKWDGTDLIVTAATVSLGPTGISIAIPPSSLSDFYGYKFQTALTGTNIVGMFATENAGTVTRSLGVLNFSNQTAYPMEAYLAAASGGHAAEVRCTVDAAGVQIITLAAGLIQTSAVCNLSVGTSVLLGTGGLFTWLNDPNTAIGNDSADRLQFVCGGATVAYMAAATAGFNALFPGTDNTYSLGTATGPFRWTAVHAVNGTIQTSDRRLKRDIVDDTALGLAFIERLRVRGYRLIDDDAYRIGFIADEVQTALEGRPFAALDNPHGLMGLNYAGFVPVLVTALQELAARVRQLEGRQR